MIKFDYIEQIKGTYENEKYDFDRYNFIKKTPLSTQEISIVVDFKGNEITGDTIVYGSWYDLELKKCVDSLCYDLELKECIDYLKTLQPSEIKRDFSDLLARMGA